MRERLWGCRRGIMWTGRGWGGICLCRRGGSRGRRRSDIRGSELVAMKSNYLHRSIYTPFVYAVTANTTHVGIGWRINLHTSNVIQEMSFF
ncbi:hypothetical protein BDZ91DRAFT_725968 [Kalaharituber pfeilii]|nr:hypothetical protein BDZ91DRAFT_725968 [Kalaharituber pfeilii]